MYKKLKIYLIYLLGFQIALTFVGCSSTSNTTPNPLSIDRENESALSSFDQNTDVLQTPTNDTTPTETVEAIALPATPTLLTSTPSPMSEESLSSSIQALEEKQTLFLLLSFIGYGKIDYDKNQPFDNNQDSGFSFTVVDEYTEQPIDGVGGPGSTTIFSFAHFSNLITYWNQDDIGQGQLWISDLELSNPQLIFTDVDGLFKQNNNSIDEVKLAWSPDDRHIFVISQQDPSPNMIYHLDTDQFENWPWACDSVAVSPRTGNVALWCNSIEGTSRFATVEWGGEIWYDSVYSAKELATKTNPSEVESWAWSSDGQLFAYFDPSESDGALKIVDNEGVLQFSFSDAAWWQTQDVDESGISLPNELLHWSQDGTRLLAFSHELIEGACPTYLDPFAPLPSPEYQLPCWQVINSQTGSVEWTWADFSTNTSTLGIESWQVWYSSISPDGNLIVFQVKPPLGQSQVAIVNVKTGELRVSQSIGTRTMRWKSLP